MPRGPWDHKPGEQWEHYADLPFEIVLVRADKTRELIARHSISNEAGIHARSFARSSNSGATVVVERWETAVVLTSIETSG